MDEKEIINCLLHIENVINTITDLKEEYKHSNTINLDNLNQILLDYRTKLVMLRDYSCNHGIQLTLKNEVYDKKGYCLLCGKELNSNINNNCCNVTINNNKDIPYKYAKRLIIVLKDILDSNIGDKRYICFRLNKEIEKIEVVINQKTLGLNTK